MLLLPASCAWYACLALNEISKRTIIDPSLLSKSLLLKSVYAILIESHVQMITINFGSVFALIFDQTQLEVYRQLQCKQCVGMLSIGRFLPLFKTSEQHLRNQENVNYSFNPFYIYIF